MDLLNIPVSSDISQWPLGQYYDFFMDWRVPVITGAVYFVTVHLLNPKKGEKREPLVSGPAFKAFILLHNLFLMLFSLIVFLNAAPHFYRFFISNGLSWDAYCDKDSKLWNPFLHHWAYIFYLSKYYEIMDTVIILLQGKQTSLLQSYHHAGAIMSMFWCTRSQTTAVWIFVCFNSFIHAIMYTYYSASTLRIKIPFKAIITYAQITQFLIGDPLATLYLVVPGCVKSEGPNKWYENERYADTYTIVYVGALVFLFVDFAKKSYSSPAKGKKE